MPKIRGFKADLWTDEDFVELSPFARLLWMGMWNYACDNGHLADKSKQIKMRVLPTDDVNCAELLRELEQNRRIVRRDGVITIPNFTRHQKPDKRYFVTCDLPDCTKPDGDSQRETRGGHTEPRSGPAVGSQGPHDEVNRGEVNRGDGEGAAADKPRSTRAHQLPADWAPSEAHASLAAERGVHLNEETVKFRDWTVSMAVAKKDWDATFRNWLRNARPTNVRHLPPQTDGQGRVILPPLPPRSPWEGS
ncbi:hypothetical protein [uncultured Arthrobacter sp.]|uniref:hypothetical protein n=1 Tax=uncultured Arthrobacter sp. TaxID=114050 RepID=UPI0025F21AF6|nr:hypothetical protein [uncultured Arthrobacter sp.]